MKKKNYLNLTCGWMCFTTDAANLYPWEGGKLMGFFPHSCTVVCLSILRVDVQNRLKLPHKLGVVFSAPSLSCTGVPEQGAWPVQKHPIIYLLLGIYSFWGGWHTPHNVGV